MQREEEGNVSFKIKFVFFFRKDELSLCRKRASADVCICACSAGTEEEEGRTERQLGGWRVTQGPGAFVSVGPNKAERWRRITATALSVQTSGH